MTALVVRSETASLSAFLPRFLAVAVQLGLILLAVYFFHLEPDLPFFLVLCLATGGFLVHAWLPMRFRLAFFCLLSLASTVALLGWTAAGWVLGLGFGLLALCQLPVPVKVRVLIITVVAIGLAGWRVEFDAPFWPIFAAMFMFRLIVYLYDLSHEKRRPPLLHSIAYFFPLPNLCFPLFPVLDFKTFRATYYDDEPSAIYQTGVAWIVRGLTHLLVYRFIRYYLLPHPNEVRDLPHLLLWLATNYALYLRISGWFHIATGVLHLFGFNLPRTHHNYFLASSVSDIWRRINIYWKDFMTKVFFYPAFFRLRKWGTRTALVIAGMWVFLVTWLLHSYQVFWLRNELPLSWRDAALWMTTSVVVAISLLLELRATGKRSTPENVGLHREIIASAVLALKIAGTFFLVSIFWACGTLRQFPLYLYALVTSGKIDASGILTALWWLLGFMTVCVVFQIVRSRLLRQGTFALAPPSGDLPQFR